MIENDATDEACWTALSYDAFGGPDQVLLGNGVQVDRASDPATGLLASSLAYLPSTPFNRVQASSFSYDSRGRMTSRTVDDQQPDTLFPQKVLRHRVEQFAHDAWSRVQRGEVTDLLAGPSPVASEAYGYSPLGNITQFPGQGSYAYSEYTYATGECAGALADPGPHAVRKVGAVQHCYNAFGEMVSAGTRTYGWDGDNSAPVSISDGSASASFVYGPDGAKRFMLASDGTTTAERWFAGEGFELDVTPSETIERLTLGDFAVLETNGTTASVRYTLRDHLGSVEVILDDDARDGLSIYDSVIRQQSFAPFGARRDSDWVGAYADTPVLDDGYTGHQMLDQFDLIHMNGRVYDPTIGRFLSPDIVIQAPYFSQSYNRYSYVMNGPMQFVDPSGYEQVWFWQDKGPGDWTIFDRWIGSDTWHSANRYNFAMGSSREYKTLSQREDFYLWVSGAFWQRGINVMWPRVAAEAVQAAKHMVFWSNVTPDSFIPNGIVGMTEQANQMIFDDVFNKLRGAYYFSEWNGDESFRQWDGQILDGEQKLVQPIYDEYFDTSELDAYTKFAKHESPLSLDIPLPVDMYNEAAGIDLLPFPHNGCLLCAEDRFLYGQSNMEYLGDSQLGNVSIGY